jgi:dihydrodipicolinate synthase/N-acetylneuraminate lyase
MAAADRLTRSTLRGTWGSVLLPLAQDDSIDVGRLAAELAVLTTAGLDGIYTCGTAGEFHTLEESEYDQVTAAVATACRAAGVPYQLGAGHMSGQLSLRRIRVAAAWDPAAIQVILPDWSPLAPPEVVAAVARMAAAARPVPLVLYNPPHAKTRLSPAQFGELAAAVPELIGIKVAGGDLGWYADMRALAGGLAVFVAGHELASGLALGASGAYSNVACLSPRGAVAWYQSMLSDPAAAAELEGRLAGFLARHVRPLQQAGYANAALDKALAAAGGWAPVGSRTRWPYRWIPDETVAVLGQAARRELAELVPD